MPGALPLVEDGGATPSLWSVGGSAGVTGLGQEASANATTSVGYGGDSQSAHLWMAGVMVAALIGLGFFHIGGFRFSTDVGVTGR